MIQSYDMPRFSYTRHTPFYEATSVLLSSFSSSIDLPEICLPPPSQIIPLLVPNLAKPLATLLSTSLLDSIPPRLTLLGALALVALASESLLDVGARARGGSGGTVALVLGAGGAFDVGRGCAAVGVFVGSSCITREARGGEGARGEAGEEKRDTKSWRDVDERLVSFEEGEKVRQGRYIEERREGEKGEEGKGKDTLGGEHVGDIGGLRIVWEVGSVAAKESILDARRLQINEHISKCGK
jgi:hypothetical protein